jgi:hypothetical protein
MASEDNDKVIQCQKCKQSKFRDNFIKSGIFKGKQQYRVICKQCHRANWQSVLYRRCRKNTKDTDIDIYYINQLFFAQGGKCYWMKIYMESDHYLLQPSLDRIDNERGYYKDNVILCSLFANRGRNQASFEEFESFIKNNLKI